jgi:hypothetical protein
VVGGRSIGGPGCAFSHGSGNMGLYCSFGCWVVGCGGLKGWPRWSNRWWLLSWLVAGAADCACWLRWLQLVTTKRDRNVRCKNLPIHVEIVCISCMYVFCYMCSVVVLRCARYDDRPNIRSVERVVKVSLQYGNVGGRELNGRLEGKRMEPYAANYQFKGWSMQSSQ